jgi:hypothetical protein
LVACEFSGIVRDAFIRAGHDAVSCDLIESEQPGPHIQADVLTVLDRGWDMMVAFPPCTALCLSGNRWYAGTPEREQALDFVRKLMDAPIPRWAIENPKGVISTAIRPPDLKLQPWQYGHPEKKGIFLWLRNLPPLMVDNWVQGPYEARILWLGESKDRQKNRSRMYEGIAAAMAEQWG